MNDFYTLNRKGMCHVYKMFSKKVDGEFSGPHKMYSKLDRKYVRNRISDAMIEYTKSSDWMHFVQDVTDDLYLVTVYVKKDSKKYEVLKKLGFSLMEFGLV